MTEIERLQAIERCARAYRAAEQAMPESDDGTDASDDAQDRINETETALDAALRVRHAHVNSLVALAITRRLTIYVDSKRGSDRRGNGDVHWPLRTLAAGMRACPPGGTVFLQAGRYR